MLTQHQVDIDAAGLPPLAPSDANDDERARAIVARMVARHGAPTIEHYRRVYQQSGVPWPGDEEIRAGILSHPLRDRGRLGPAAVVDGRLSAVVRLWA